MSQRSTTPDERFLLKLYQTAMENGDPFLEIDYRGVARAIGQKETAINANDVMWDFFTQQ